MSRIYCKTPSTAFVANYTIPNKSVTTIPAGSWVTLAEAPDFSVPDSQGNYINDPSDSTRGIRPGEVFFITPIFVRNNTVSSQTLEVRLVLEDGTVVPCPGLINIPGGDTSLIPLQGRSLVKRNYTSTNGDRIQVKTITAGSLSIWASGEVKLSAEHTQLRAGSATL